MTGHVLTEAEAVIVDAIARWLEGWGILTRGLAQDVRAGVWLGLVNDGRGITPYKPMTDDERAAARAELDEVFGPPILKIHAGADAAERDEPAPTAPAPAGEPPTGTSPAAPPADPFPELRRLVEQGVLSPEDLKRTDGWSPEEAQRLLEIVRGRDGRCRPNGASASPSPAAEPEPAAPAEASEPARGDAPPDEEDRSGEKDVGDLDEVPDPDELTIEERTPDEDTPLEPPAPELVEKVAAAASRVLPDPVIESVCVNATGACKARVVVGRDPATGEQGPPLRICVCGASMVSRLMTDPEVPHEDNVALLVDQLLPAPGAEHVGRACSACGDKVKAEDRIVLLAKRGLVEHLIHSDCAVTYAPERCVIARPDPDPLGERGDRACDECGVGIKPGEKWVRVGPKERGTALHATPCPEPGALGAREKKARGADVDWSTAKASKKKGRAVKCARCTKKIEAGQDMLEVGKRRAHAACPVSA